MALTPQAFNLSSSSSSPPPPPPPPPNSYLTYYQPIRIRATFRTPTNQKTSSVALPTLTPTTIINSEEEETKRPILKDEKVVDKLYAIAEAASDRSEMHKIIGEQRNNWNHLLVHSINSITLTASITVGISSMLQAISPHLHLAFKISSAFLFVSSTALMMITNKIQPSQLAEEQRNAARLFKQLEKSIYNSLALRIPREIDVDEAMERVLALDKAYPLQLFPGMLEKFPKEVEPTQWWPKIKHSNDVKLQKDMEGIVEMLKRKDIEQYVTFGKLVLGVNRILAALGPMLSGLATIGTSLIGIGSLGPWPMLIGVVGGAGATVVNTLQHGGQVGMVFELSRNCAGFYQQLEEEIRVKLGKGDEEQREDKDLFKMKVALRLGRSQPELEGIGSDGEVVGEFAGKLF